MTTTREQIAAAALALVNGAYAWGQPASPRLVLWGSVDVAQRPAAFLVVAGETHVRKNPTLVLRTLKFKLYVYINARPTDDATTTGGTQFAQIITSLETALAPAGGDIFTKRNTLGGLASHCFIEGQVAMDTGDLDGDGVAIIPISILVP